MELWEILCNFWPIFLKSSIKPLTRNHSCLVWRVLRYGVHSLPKLHSSTYYPIMRYLYCILLHAWPILLLNIPLCIIHIAFCYMNVTFGYMPFVNLIFYYAILIWYFGKWMVAHSCIMRHCIMRYESSIRRDVFCSVVFRFMNEPGRLLVRHLMDKCFFQSAQSAS